MIASLLVGSLLGVLSFNAAPAQADVPVPGVYLNSAGSPLLPLLQSANQSIDIEIYTMKDPTVHSLIRQALKRGVHVRILKDPNPFEEPCNTFLPVGQTGTPADDSASCRDERQLVQDVQNAGGTFQPFDKSTLCPNGGKSSYGGAAGTGCFEHGKIAIVDGSTALLSSGNFDETNLCIDSPSRCNRDYTIIENDQTIVSTLENIFESDLRGNSYDVRTLIPSQLADSLTVSPYSLQPILNFINSAQSSIDLETQYLKDPEMNSALVNAAKRGVKVNVTVASLCAFGTPTPNESKTATAIYSAFDNAGISAAMFNASNTINGKPGYLHAKAIIVDGNRAWVGSENGSTESLTENREYGIIFDDASWVQSLQRVVTGDHNSPESETWRESLQCAKDKGSLGAKVPDPTIGDGGVPVTTKEPKRPRKPKPAPVVDNGGSNSVNPDPVVSNYPPVPSKPPRTKKPRKPRKPRKPGTVAGSDDPGRGSVDVIGVVVGVVTEVPAPSERKSRKAKPTTHRKRKKRPSYEPAN